MKRLDQTGKINLMGLFIVLGLAGAGYFCSYYVPAWYDNQQLRSAVREAASQAWKIHEDDQLRTHLLIEMGKLKPHWLEVDKAGVVTEKVGFPFGPENFLVQREEATKRIAIEISYERYLRLPFTQELRLYHFEAVGESDLNPPKWDD